MRLIKSAALQLKHNHFLVILYSGEGAQVDSFLSKAFLMMKALQAARGPSLASSDRECVIQLDCLMKTEHKSGPLIQKMHKQQNGLPVMTAIPRR
jgi:hypothetical protein